MQRRRRMSTGVSSDGLCILRRRWSVGWPLSSHRTRSVCGNLRIRALIPKQSGTATSALTMSHLSCGNRAMSWTKGQCRNHHGVDEIGRVGIGHEERRYLAPAVAVPAEEVDQADAHAQAKE